MLYDEVKFSDWSDFLDPLFGIAVWEGRFWIVNNGSVSFALCHCFIICLDFVYRWKQKT